MDGDLNPTVLDAEELDHCEKCANKSVIEVGAFFNRFKHEEMIDMEMNYSEDSWSLNPSVCPCDIHFTEYLASVKAEGKFIFHFGTGGHHLVGRDNHRRGNPNEILGITASREEHQSYMDFVVQNPIASNYYKVLFADVYTLSPRILPTFDFVTLFHLAEFYDNWESRPREKRLNSSYARLNDKELLELFLSKLNPVGKLLFFKRSYAFLEKPYPAATLVSDFISRGHLILEDEYESLMICKKAS
jgi:hypothetical protein